RRNMRRLVLGLTASIAVLGWGTWAHAQQQQEEPAPAEEPAETKPAQIPTEQPAEKAPPSPHSQWSDIDVIPRKAVLKTNRLELAPYAGITLNDPLIRHFAIGGVMTYYISDVFGVGIEGTYYKREI